MNLLTLITRPRMAGILALVCLVLTLAACDGSVGSKGTYSGSLNGRTPETFASACADISGTLRATSSDSGVASTCTAANGDFVTCNWEEQRCSAECRSSEQECDKLRFMAIVWPGQPSASPSTQASHDTTDDTRPAGEQPLGG